MTNEELQKLMNRTSEPDDELVQALHNGILPPYQFEDETAANTLIAAGYLVRCGDGGVSLTESADTLLAERFPDDFDAWNDHWRQVRANEEKTAEIRRVAAELKHHVDHGQLQFVDGRYRITKRGYRVVCTWFAHWLSQSKVRYEYPPEAIVLLYVDGKTEEQAIKAYYERYSKSELYWSRIHKSLRERLTEEQKSVLGIAPPRHAAVPDWLLRLSSDAVSALDDERNHGNKLRDASWGRELLNVGMFK